MGRSSTKSSSESESRIDEGSLSYFFSLSTGCANSMFSLLSVVCLIKLPAVAAVIP